TPQPTQGGVEHRLADERQLAEQLQGVPQVLAGSLEGGVAWGAAAALQGAASLGAAPAVHHRATLARRPRHGQAARRGTAAGALRAVARPRYRDGHAVRDVTVRIDPGEIVACLGPNGAGKTTTLKMLAGLLYPTSGRVEATGFVPWTGGPPFKRRIALVLGNRQQLVWDLPPEETFLLNRAIYDIPAGDYRERLAELVTLLELGDVLQKPVRQLSLGERMKCEL